MESRNHEEYIEHTFDSFCKKALKHDAIDLYRALMRRSKREVTFSELTVSELASMAAIDKYFASEHVFDVLGESVGVSDSDLAEALTALPADRRDIVLMSYFFDMTDTEIAERLKMARSTVAYKRTNSLQKLKKLLESED
jgi:RNA polymerase sigma factor (sigma-70 family)